MRLIYPSNHKLFVKEDTYALRGLCMIIIIIGHIYHNLAIHYNLYTYNSLLSYFLSNGGCWATGCFFLLSGYGLNHSLEKKQINFQYITKHISNILFPYIFAYTINIIITGSFQMIYKGWFYKTIFVVYILTFTIYYFFKNQKTRLIIIGSGIVLYILIASVFTNLPQWYTNTIICFPLGILCSIIYIHKKYSHLILLCISFLLFLMLEKFGFHYSQYILSPLFAFISIYLVSIININCNILNYIGEKSIMFYVLQIALLDPLVKIKSPIIYILAIFIIIYIITIIYYKITSKFQFSSKKLE